MKGNWEPKYGPDKINFPPQTKPILEKEKTIDADPEYLKMNPGAVRAFLVTMFREGKMTKAYVTEKLAEIGYRDEVFFETKNETRFVDGEETDDSGKKKKIEKKVPINRVRIKLPDWKEGNASYIEI